MVAIVAGNGLGLLNTSLNILGGVGVLGQSVLGQRSSRVIVNAVSGNLVLQMQDERLASRGLDLYALRIYNSPDTLNDGDGDGWRWGYEQAVRFQELGTPAQPQADATVIRTDGDGHETTYTWNAARAAYISTKGSGTHDELRYDSVPGCDAQECKTLHIVVSGAQESASLSVFRTSVTHPSSRTISAGPVRLRGCYALWREE